jgi:hypothetical protein
MLFWLTQFSDGGDFFNLFRYITFRAGAAFFTALIFGFMFGRPLIDLLRRRQGMGWGDPKMLGMIGAFLGVVPALPLVVFLAAASACRACGTGDSRATPTTRNSEHDDALGTSHHAVRARHHAAPADAG